MSIRGSDRQLPALRWTGVWSISILISALVLRFFGLGQESLWTDEAHTSWLIRLNWGEMFNALRNPGGNLPAFFVAAKITTSIFSENEFTLRLVSAAVGVAGVLIAMNLGRTVGGIPGMIGAGWLWAFHPMLVWYSRDARTYSLSGTLSLALLFCFLRLREGGDRRLWPIAAIISIVGALSHYYFFAFEFILILIAIPSIRINNGFFRSWVLLTFISWIPLAIWLIWFFTQTNPSLGSGWIQTPGWRDMILTAWNLLSGYAGRTTPSNLLFGLCTALVALMANFRSGRLSANRWLALVGIVVPIAAVFIVSQRQPLYVDRYFLVFLPFYLVLFAEGISYLRAIFSRGNKSKNDHEWAYGAALVILFAIGFSAGWRTLVDPHYRKEDWKTLTEELNLSTADGADIWFSDEGSIVPFVHYFNQDFNAFWGEERPGCVEGCYWVLRQPFTDTHAFTQAINPSNREWIPETPPGCAGEIIWEDGTGIILVEMDC